MALHFRLQATPECKAIPAAKRDAIAREAWVSACKKATSVGTFLGSAVAFAPPYIIGSMMGYPRVGLIIGATLLALYHFHCRVEAARGVLRGMGYVGR